MVPQSRSSAPFIVLGVCFRINLKSTAISPIRPQRQVQEVFFSSQTLQLFELLMVECKVNLPRSVRFDLYRISSHFGNNRAIMKTDFSGINLKPTAISPIGPPRHNLRY